MTTRKSPKKSVPPVPVVSDLVAIAGAMPPKTVVIPGGHREDDLRLVESARDHGIIKDCLLVGDSDRIKAATRAVGIRVSARHIFHTASADDTAAKTVELVRKGRADIILKGDISTPILNRAMLQLRVRNTIGLVTMFVVHIGLVIWLWFNNRSARGSDRYQMSRTKQRTWVRFFASKTMVISGLIMLVFLVVHVYDFRLQHMRLNKIYYGHLDTAMAEFEHVASFTNDLGLFAEEIDPATGAALGNFPQAFTHVGAINAARAIASRMGAAPPAARVGRINKVAMGGRV